MQDYQQPPHQTSDPGLEFNLCTILLPLRHRLLQDGVEPFSYRQKALQIRMYISPHVQNLALY